MPSPERTGITCASCGKTFEAGVSHDCRVTRAEFEQMRADVRTLVLWIVKNHTLHTSGPWMPLLADECLTLLDELRVIAERKP